MCVRNFQTRTRLDVVEAGEAAFPRVATLTAHRHRRAYNEATVGRIGEPGVAAENDPVPGINLEALRALRNQNSNLKKAA